MAITAVAAMTKPLGRRARWGSVALVAPLAAGALAAATSWGVAHQPATSGTSSSPGEASDDGVQAVSAVQETQGRDKSLVALQKQASTEQARVIRLQHILHRVNARTRALALAPIPGYHGASSTGSVSVGSSSAGGTVAAPPRGVAAPAPATHASTGAS
jgi:hypothetical protein